MQKSAGTLTIAQIMEILPHRYPLLLIDRITEFEPMKRAVGYKNVTANEPVFMGHFPGLPVMPGVYMIEALAQLGGTTILMAGDFRRKTAYLAGADKMKFRRPVVPGDRLDMETNVLRVRKTIAVVAVEARVDGQMVCSGELMFSFGPLEHFGMDASILHE